MPYSNPSAKASVIDPGDEAPFLVRGRPGEHTLHQGFVVYPKCSYCMLTSMHEASPTGDEKDAIRGNHKALDGDCLSFRRKSLSSATGLRLIVCTSSQKAVSSMTMPARAMMVPVLNTLERRLETK